MQSEAVSRMQRLHPASLLFSIGSVARSLLLPGLLFLFFSRGSQAQLWIMVFFLPVSVAVALVRYWSFRYSLGAEEIVIREGIVTRNERHLPYARIQNVDLVQNPVHRMLGVAVVRLETASGEKPEAVMRVVSLPAVETLRAAVSRGRSGGEAPPEAGAVDSGPAVETRELLRLPTRELAMLGLISNRGLALVAAALGLLWQSDLVDIDEQVEQLPEQAEAFAGKVDLPGPAATVLLALGLLLGLVVLLRVLSVVWSILKYHGFRLTLQGPDLRSEYGLLTRVSATIPRRRIQRVSSSTRPMHRWCGRATVQAETAGGTEGDSAGAADRQSLAPLIPADRLNEFMRQVLPQIDLDEIRWSRLSRRAGWRIARRSLIFTALVAAGATRLVWPWGLLLLIPGAAWSLFHASRYVRHTSYALVERGLVYRSGWWVRRITAVPFEKIQAVSLRESPWDRRNRMAGVAIDTAGAGGIEHAVEVRYLEVEDARTLAARLGSEAAGTAFRW